MPVTKFISEAQRQQHPQVKLLPLSLWTSPIFWEEIGDELLPFFNTKDGSQLRTFIEDFVKKIDDSKLVFSEKKRFKRMAFFGIAYANPDFSDNKLKEIATQLTLGGDWMYLITWLGEVELAKSYVDGLSPSGKKEFLEKCPSYYSEAAMLGHLNMMQYIESLDLRLSELIAFNEFAPYRLAAGNGQLPTLKYLESKASQITSDYLRYMILNESYPLNYGRFVAFIDATERGHVDVMAHIYSNVCDEDKELFHNTLNNRLVFLNAVYGKRFDAAKYLLSISDLTWKSVNSLGDDVIKQFVAEQLKTLKQQKMTNPNFNLTDDRQARIALLMAKEIIRLNDDNLSQELVFLFSIPALRALVHSPSGTKPFNNENELLSDAIRYKNKAAEKILNAQFGQGHKNSSFGSDYAHSFHKPAAAPTQESEKHSKVTAPIKK